MSYCDCGADDCPRCNPGCDDRVACDRCGELFTKWTLTEDAIGRWMCEDCWDRYESATEDEIEDEAIANGKGG